LSPKIHAPPLGVFDDKSVNEIVAGTAPEVGVPTKLATGATADTGVMVNDTINKRMHRTILTEFLMIDLLCMKLFDMVVPHKTPLFDG
jgi:hypothetical protein